MTELTLTAAEEGTFAAEASENQRRFTDLVLSLAEVLPPHACARTNIFESQWLARWTTPDGLWTLAVENPGHTPMYLTIDGPYGFLRLDQPPSAKLALAVLREWGALS
jgi:hypothetical protein